jgi:hypothetical protein
MCMLENLIKGAMAGLAGTTALNAVTYLDMVWRGRPASSTPEQVVEELAKRSGRAIPGDGQQRPNRVQALGALAGIATGVAVGAAAGQFHGLVRKLGPVLGPDWWAVPRWPRPTSACTGLASPIRKLGTRPHGSATPSLTWPTAWPPGRCCPDELIHS